MLTPSQVITINETIDAVHSTFPNLMAVGVVCIIASYLPAKKLETHFEFSYYWAIGAFGLLFVLYLLSQAFLGGCFIHIPQNWLAERYLVDRPEWWPFGLYGRQGWPGQLWSLQLFYIIISLFSSWRFWEYYHKFLVRHNVT